MKYKMQIIAPSSGIKDGDILANQIAELFTAQGFEVNPPIDLFGDNKHYYANTAEARFEQTKSAILDPEVDIIMAFRGGYGASEVATQCVDIKPSHNKILIGFSDITFLHGLFNYTYKMPSIHGPVGTSLLDKTPKHMRDIVEVLGGKSVEVSLLPVNNAAYGFACKSTLTGGNLTVFTTMISTNIHPKTSGKILLLEDVGEKGYSIARMLNHLAQADLLENIDAIVLGDFTNSDEHLEFAFEDFCMRNSHIPVFKCEGIGHGDTNTPLTLGSAAQIENNILTVTSPFGK